MNALLFASLVASAAPAPLPQLAGKYAAVHPDWKDSLQLNADGSFAREHADGGKWTFDGKSLLLVWKNAGPEQVEFKGPGRFEAKSKPFTLTLLLPPKFESIPGIYQGEHEHWKDLVTLRIDGTHARSNGDPGIWIYNGKELVLYWKASGPETLLQQADGSFANPTFKLTRKTAAPAPIPVPVAAATAPSSRHIAVDKATYKVGEVVVVTYRAMKGSASDWTTVIAKTEPEDNWGNWEYTNGSATGSRKVSARLTPGEYEARVYVKGAIKAEDRVSFTVVQ